VPRAGLNLVVKSNICILAWAGSSGIYISTFREKTGAQNIVKEIKQYQKKWLQHLQRMDTNRIPKQALQYRPKGRRNIG
jgi:hypothetical protein